MRKKTLIKNTNIRLNLMEPEDKRAWEYLQTMDRKEYKSYSRAVVAAVNDYFTRKAKLDADPYLETREKEDDFLEKVLEAVEKGARESMPMVMMGNLVSLLGQSVSHQALDVNGASQKKKLADEELDVLQDTEESVDEALDFIDGF